MPTQIKWQFNLRKRDEFIVLRFSQSFDYLLKVMNENFLSFRSGIGNPKEIENERQVDKTNSAMFLYY